MESASVGDTRQAGVMEQADIADSKSAAERREGSNPSTRTTQYKVEGLESRCGTGWHVTFHTTIDRALGAADMLLQQPNIDHVRITQCEHSPQPPSLASSLD